MKLLVLLAVASGLFAQTRPSRGNPGRGDNIGSVVDAVATFTGTFKYADRKFVEIELESGDVMRMYLTRGTKFVKNGETVKASAFHEGDHVTADATRDARLNLLAVKLEGGK